MGRVWVAINAYEEAGSLSRAIASARRAAPKASIVVVDGAYAKFPHVEGPESTDGTIEEAERLADLVIRCREVDGKRVAWTDEVEKRNAYFVGEVGDTYVVLDADEELRGSVPERFFVHDMDVMLQRDDEVPPSPVYRVHAHREGMRYEGAHNALWVGDRLINSERRHVAKEFSIFHHAMKRPASRTARKGIYYEWLVEYEKEFRQRHAMV